MLKRYWRVISGLERIADILAVLIAFFASYYFRDDIIRFLAKNGFKIFTEKKSLASVSNYLVVLLFSFPYTFIILNLIGASKSMRKLSLLSLFRMGIALSFFLFLAISATLYIFKIDLSRSLIIFFSIFSGIFFFIERLLVLKILRFFRARGRNYRNIIIVGFNQQSISLYKDLSEQLHLGIRVIGFIRLPNQQSGIEEGANLSDKIIGNHYELEDILRKRAIDEVIITEIGNNYSLIQNLVKAITDQGVAISIVADLFGLNFIKSDISYLNDTAIIHFQQTPGDPFSLVIKRLFDIIFSIILMVLFFIPSVIIAAVIKLTSKGPIFFKQKRIGWHGRVFTMYKLRSMVVDAEKLKKDLKDQNQLSGPIFKLSNDPRITKVGKIIRKFSLDEVPQLYNILLGDMSLVGPRPPVPSEVKLYESYERRRLSLRPGLTGLWQTSGRNSISDFKKVLELDLKYIDNWSLWLDTKILLKTIPVVILGKGAS